MVVVENLSNCVIVDDMKYVYNYRMLKDKLMVTTEGDAMEVQTYGIEVERQDIVNEVLVGVERDSIKNISPHRHKVHNLLKLLCDNSVSPFHLIDVIGEYVDEYVDDFDEVLDKIATN